jgi:hypothetical protein
MPLRRTGFGSIAATALILGLSGCGSDEHATPRPVSDTPQVTSSSPASSPPPTPVDPAAAAKAKVMSDYKYFVAFWTKGTLSGDPTYPYEQTMAGEALRVTKSASTADHLRGIKFSGSTSFLRGSVVALDLKAKPATARVQACELDQISGVDSKGKRAYNPAGQVSTDITLTLLGGRWKVTGQAVAGKDEGACAS